jgi:YfiH family protein
MQDFFKEKSESLIPELVSGVRILFTEREGGVSSGPWGGAEGIMGLNVATHVGDNAACVRMNRSIVSQMTPSVPRWMTQVHGTEVADAESVTDDALQADAQTCVTPGVVCAVQVADCLPVLIADSKARGVAAIHAGWKGQSAGIIEKAVARLRERLSDPEAQILAWLGPRIGADDFEVGPEVVQAFEQKYGEVSGAVRSASEGKYLLSLAAYAKQALAAAGVRQVEDCGLSTYADPRRFYSF